MAHEYIAVSILQFEHEFTKWYKNSVDPDQTAATEGAVWPGSTLFAKTCLKTVKRLTFQLLKTKIPEWYYNLFSDTIAIRCTLCSRSNLNNFTICFCKDYGSFD